MSAFGYRGSMLSTSFPYLTGQVEVTVDYPGYVASDQLSAEGVQYVRHLLASISRAKEFAAADLLETYNDSWREPGEPKLTQDQFGEALQLTAVQVLDEPGAANVFFSDDDMFGGHSVVVNFDDADPSYVTLFG